MLPAIPGDLRAARHAVCEETLFKYVLAYVQLGEPARAREYWAKCVALVPVFSAEWTCENLFQRWNFPEADTELCIQVLAKAAPPSPLSA